jgi:methyl-accepting chemotaxis protein
MRYLDLRLRSKAAKSRNKARNTPRKSFRFSLRWRIALLGIGGLLLIGMVYFVGSQIENRKQEIADQSAALATDVAALSQDMLQAKQIATEFLLRHSQAAIDRHAAIIVHARGLVAAIGKLVASLDSADPLRQADAFGAGINMYATRFQSVASGQKNLGFDENEGLQGKLRDAVHKAESRLGQIDEPRLTVLMLMMRRHEKDFMLHGDEKYGDEFTKRQSEFADGLKISGLSDGVRDEISSLMKVYRESFNRYMVTQSSLNDEVDDFATVFQRNRPALDALVKAADERYRLSEAHATQLRHYLIWTIAGATFCIGLLAVFFGHRIASSIARMTQAMQKLASGDFAVVLPGLGRADEVGDMAQAVETFKIRAKQKADDEAAAKMRQEASAAEARKADMNKLADEFEGAVGRIIDAVSAASTELETAARTLTATADRSQQLTDVVAAASEDASTNVQSVASATEQMTSSVNEISRQVQNSARIANEAVAQAQATTHRVAELSNAASRIGDVIELIYAIARQTNLLALNATIEAARAGDAGRGFAVVASEVKALADQTAKATGEISEQVSGIQDATRESATAINAIGGTIERMSDIASTIASAVEQQGAATQEISRNVRQAAHGTQQVSSNITDVQRGATETGSASSQVLSAAQSLSGESNRLKLEVGKFLNSVRAA